MRDRLSIFDLCLPGIVAGMILPGVVLGVGDAMFPGAFPEGIPAGNISSPGGRDRRSQRYWFCKSAPSAPQGSEIPERHLVQVSTWRP